MLSLISLIVIISLSMLVTKIASIMLVHTGLSSQSAAFQARSAFTGVGFTTHEAETVVNHPVRRKIIMTLMLIGNAGIITAMASLMLTFVTPGETYMSWPVKLGILIASVILLWLIARSQAVNRFLSRLINRALDKYTDLTIRDYNTLLHISGGYSITELKIEEDDWLRGKTLKNAQLRDEGLNVLSIERADGTFLGAPIGDTEIEDGDILFIYGKEEVLAMIDDRKNDFFGDLEHSRAAEKQKEEVKEEQKIEQERKKRSNPAQ
ncbi:MAG: TrkA C-terminal domain-containing protein [Candidatus Cyclobacteriaceae bacterium M2_1C_046]